MNDSELDQLLASMHAPPPPPGFQREVWLRIDAAESAGWKSAVSRTIHRVLDLLTMPPVAVATCTAMILVGSWFGMNLETASGGGQTAYVQSVSPFLSAHHR